MSGGHFDYLEYQVLRLADEIEGEFINDGKYEAEDYGNSPVRGKYPMIELDRLEGADPQERESILNEVRSLVDDLKKCSARAKELDYFLSGDTGIKSYLTRLSKIK